MSKRKNKTGKRIAQGATALKENGLKAFQRGDYTQAISTWERIIPELRPIQALAEAYFRRGLSRLYGKQSEPQAGLRDLQQAHETLPEDPGYAYHLGLACHKQGDLEAALNAYQVARKGKNQWKAGEFRSRAAYPLALALLQKGEEPFAIPAWRELQPEEQAMLEEAGAFRRRPYQLSAQAPVLWQALAAYDAGEWEKALSGLNRSLQSTDDPAHQGLAHYYLGALAAHREDWDTARREWTEAYRAGLRTDRLEANLGELYHRIAEERLAEGDAETALEAAHEAARHMPSDKGLAELLSQAHQQLAYQAAAANQWDKAREHWKMASEADRSSFRLAYNLALAHERAEAFVDAAEAWREALRRRPRHSDHPDAISDEQVARLWQRAAEDYRAAGEGEQAIKVYQQAVKWNPDNLETRLALAGGLLADGRLQAAGNELDRILERDPNHIPALLMRGEVLNQSDQWWTQVSAQGYWQRVLELQPDHELARQFLADFHVEQAEIDYSWERYAEAIQDYQKALEYRPKNAEILAYIGNCYIQLGEDAHAQAYIDLALATDPKNLDVYNEFISAWLDTNHPDLAWQMLEKAEAALDAIPYEFYIAKAAQCLEGDHQELANPWLERAVAKAPPGAPVLTTIGEMAVRADAFEIAQRYLEQAIAAGQEPGQAHLMMGILCAKKDDLKTAKKHWNQAEKIARQSHDEDLAERVDFARFTFSGPHGLFDFLLRGAPAGRLPFPDLFGDEFFNDEDEPF